MAPVTMHGSLTADPVAAFMVPGKDEGLKLLHNPGAAWTPVTGGTIHGLGISDHAEINDRWAQQRKKVAEQFLFDSIMEFATGPALVEGLGVKRTALAVKGKWLLGGPSGDRALANCQQAWKKSAKRPSAWPRRLSRHFDKARKGASLPRHTGPVPDVPFVVEAKNLQNYYHFTKEVLAALTALDDLPGFRGEVVIVYHRRPPTPFVMAFIEALFPELADRVRFVPAPATFERAIICWYGDYVELQRGKPWHEQHVFETAHKGAGISMVMRHAGYARALRLLRQRALNATARLDFSHLPRRFWVTRKAGHDRAMQMEPRLIAELAKRGFETLAFEDLSPLEQIGAMARAEAMASYHGAGFTNVIYAAPETRIFELGTLQTGIQRCADFSAFAHVSGVDYTLAVADFDHDGEALIPPMRGKGLYPVKLSEAGMGRFLDAVDMRINDP